jgi:hypothetical protein
MRSLVVVRCESRDAPCLRGVLVGGPNRRRRHPIERRYHGLITFGLEDRATLDAVLASPHLERVLRDQNRVLISLHAHGIERSVPLVTAGG